MRCKVGCSKALPKQDIDEWQKYGDKPTACCFLLSYLGFL